MDPERKQGIYNEKKMSTSILENRPALAAAVWQVAETAGYLWEKGWAERNGGNITVNITEHVDDEMRRMPAITEPKPRLFLYRSLHRNCSRTVKKPFTTV